MQTTTMVNHHSMFAIHTTLTPGEEVENKELILGGFWLRLKESYRASPDTFTVRRATLTVFFTYVVPILIAGATFCIPLEPAFEGREANRTFLWVVYPMQQFLRFAGCAQVTCVFANDGRKMTKWNFAINMAVALLFTLFLWILLLFLSDNWAFPVPFFDVYTGPLCIPLIGATITALGNWIGNKEPSSVAPEKADPPPLAQDAPDGAKLKLKLHGKLSDDSPYRHFFAVMDYGIPSCWVVIPLSSGLFQATSGYGQNAAVLGLAGARLGYRMLVKRTSEQWLRPDQRMCFLFLMGIVIDLMYEFHCALLFGAFDTTISMMIPPVVDLIDNIWVIRKCVNEKNMLAREELIVTIVAREVVELVSSIGALILFPIIWTTERKSFFLIDEISPERFQRGMIGLGVDLVTELAVLFVFSKILASRFQVKLPNLILSMTEAVGRFSMFSLICCKCTYITSFMMYHYGSDASFKFEWLAAGNFSEVCEARQAEGMSCYA